MCPLTMGLLKVPMKSSKCKHVFEKEAIISHIKMRETQRDVYLKNGFGLDAVPKNWRHVRCPVPGCSAVLTRQDLVLDEHLKRKIEDDATMMTTTKCAENNECQERGDDAEMGVKYIDLCDDSDADSDGK